MILREEFFRMIRARLCGRSLGDSKSVFKHCKHGPSTRPLVIARKISFGSQSVAGAHTREILMSVLHSLQKQTPDVPVRLKAALDRLAEDPPTDLFHLFFPSKGP